MEDASCNGPIGSDLTYRVPSHLQPHVQEALPRLGYLLSGVTIDYDGECLICVGSDNVHWDVICQEISYALFRAKVRAEGADQRATLFKVVFGS